MWRAGSKPKVTLHIRMISINKINWCVCDVLLPFHARWSESVFMANLCEILLQDEKVRTTPHSTRRYLQPGNVVAILLNEGRRIEREVAGVGRSEWRGSMLKGNGRSLHSTEMSLDSKKEVWFRIQWPNAWRGRWQERFEKRSKEACTRPIGPDRHVHVFYLNIMTLKLPIDYSLKFRRSDFSSNNWHLASQ